MLAQYNVNLAWQEEYIVLVMDTVGGGQHPLFVDQRATTQETARPHQDLPGPFPRIGSLPAHNARLH
jgi:hypothetical protein